MVTEPVTVVTWGELHGGAVQVLADAGFTEVSAPPKRRRVMRIDFTSPPRRPRRPRPPG
jgi:hypothetical protein